MKHLLLTCFSMLSIALSALGVKWEVETTNALPYDVRAFHGETFTLEAVIKERGALIDDAASVVFYYQTPEMEGHEWYTTPATWSRETATVTLTFTPALDVGSDSYRFFFGIETAQGKNYRAFGTLRLKPSPGFSPATLAPTDVRELFKQEILAELLQSLESTFAPTVHAHNMDDINGLQSALDGKADAFTVEQTLNESENPVSANAVYQNLGNVVRYQSSGATQKMEGKHGSVILTSTNDGKGGFYVGGSTQSTASILAWIARYQNEGIKVFREAGTAAEDYSFKPGDDNQIARKKDLANISVDLTPYLKKSEVDSSFSYTSTNPVQNKVVYSALQNRMTWSDMDNALSGCLKSGDSPYSSEFDDLFGGYDAFREQPATLTVASSQNGGVLGFTEINGTGYIAWKSDNDGQRRKYALGGGNTEVWKGNVGFGEQDTFISGKPIANGEGQFGKGYPRWHNRGQDIHEVSGFSRDSRDDETVWSHRLLLPWDLAKANDTSYLMAGVVWEGNRNLIFNGDTTTFVQPLVPTNKGNNTQYLPYAIPAFENSPMFWKGQILWHDGKTTLSKSVIVPWDRVTGTTANPTELALKSDLDGKVNVDALKYFPRWDDSPNAVITFGDGFQDPDKAVFLTSDRMYHGNYAGFAFADGVMKWVDNSGNVHTEILGGASGDDEPWVSPGDWHLTVRSSEDYATVSTTEVTTATQGDRVMGETTVTTHASPIKDVSVEMLDLSMPSAPIPVTFTCEGATLTPSSSACRASATTEGLYRIFATDAQGRTRDAYLNLRTKTKATTTKAYLSDVEGSARKVANDRMLSVLAARDRSHTVAVGQTSAVASCDKAFNGTTPLASASLAPTYFCMVEPKTTWGPDAVAVAPHFAVTAAHWQPSATKTATFVTPEGSVSTVSGSTGTSLTAWARANGYSESEIDEADIDDIYVWHFSSGTIPDACIPYVMDLKARNTYYKDDLYGIVAYTITQNGYLSYAPLLAADGSRYAFGTFNATTTRADMLEQLAPACCATIYGGDSGRPVLMIHEEKPVLLSTFWKAGSGPSFVKACDILDAYIHQQSGGAEALKRIE